MTISTAAECGRELCYGCKAPFKGECNQECPENLAGAGASMSACAWCLGACKRACARVYARVGRATFRLHTKETA